MKFSPLIALGRRRAIREFERTNWHRAFAWWPINVGGNDWRWLEAVQRRGWYDHSKNRSEGPPFRWEYRAIGQRAA